MPLSPLEAVNRVNEQVTVEMLVMPPGTRLENFDLSVTTADYLQPFSSVVVRVK